MWISLKSLGLAASLVGLGIANPSWLLHMPITSRSPRAYTGGAVIALLYAVTLLLFDKIQRR
jgi:hypothetical protein